VRLAVGAGSGCARRAAHVTYDYDDARGTGDDGERSLASVAGEPLPVDAIAYRTTDDGHRCASAACGRPRRGAVARRTTDDGRGSGPAVRADRRLRPVIAGCIGRPAPRGGSSAGVDRHHAEKTSEEGGAEDPSI